MRRIAIGFLVMSLGAVPLKADIRVVRSVNTEVMAGMGGGPKESTTWISGDKHREELNSQGKPTMLEKLAGIGRPEITRLDKKVKWFLDVSKKRYEERSLIVPTSQDPSEKESQNEGSSSTPDKPTMKITKAEFKTILLNQKKQIGAFACEGYQIRSLLEMEDLESHERTEMRMVTTLWTTPETGAVAQLKKEETAYSQAYLKTLGMTEAKDAMKMLGATMLAGLIGSGEKELSSALAGMPAELKKVKGYPILSQVDWYGKGAGLGGEEEAKTEMSEMPTDVESALGGFAANFAKKKMDAKKPAPSADGDRVFSVTTEIKSISTAALPAATFEIPAGYKKAN